MDYTPAHSEISLKLPLSGMLRSNLAVFILCVKYRLLYYFSTTGKSLRHHWQWILIIYGIFYLLIDLRDVAEPILGTAGGKSQTYGNFVRLAIFHLVALIWTIIQSNATSGGETKHYLNTLPINRITRQLTDVVIQIISNNILWIPFIISLLISSDIFTSRSELIKVDLAVLCIAFLMIGIQIQWLSDRKLGLAIGIGIDFLLFLACANLKGFAAIATISGLLICSVCLVYVRLPNIYLFRPILVIAQITNMIWLKTFSFKGRFPIANLQFNILFIENNLYTSTRILLAFCALLFAWATVHYGHGYNLTYILSIIATCISGFILSGLYRPLSRAHITSQPYIFTLPFPKYYWPAKDTFFVTMINVCLMSPFIAIFLTQHWLTLAESLMILLISLSLTALLRLSILFGGSHTVLATSALTIGWITIGLYFS